MSNEFIATIDDDITEEELLEQVDFERMPRHVCIIMDGNRRWAKEKGMPGFLGHKQGVESFRTIMIAACELGIKHLTIYAFSMENWKRTSKEISVLMKLFEDYCNNEKQLMKEIGVQFHVLGEISALAPNVSRAMKEAGEYTKDGDRMKLNICVNYGGRYEILRGALKLADDIKEGRVNPDEVTEDDFSNYLYTVGQPDPDLMIRTSGELRISNFLLWQNAYSEFWFTNKYWPDLDKKALLAAIVDFQKRDRRYGGGKTKL
ncbi:MAG: isoprenyl transferase [Candidatus Eremiobacteraeota bacterium]|nr:isoprenyl transferase [Candidatus Eremiobacteraeota bacterium]